MDFKDNSTDSKHYTNFKFCEKIISFYKHIDLQRQAIYVDKESQKSLNVLEDGASGHMEQVIVKICSKQENNTLN
jgi:hypothetical protein